MKILITDDSQFMRSILKDIVVEQYADATFVEASNGNEAVSLCASESPDLLMLDLIMPEKGGIEVLREIKDSFKGKAVVISAMGQDKIIEEAKSEGASDFIVKPFEKQQVLDTIKQVLG